MIQPGPGPQQLYPHEVFGFARRAPNAHESTCSPIWPPREPTEAAVPTAGSRWPRDCLARRQWRPVRKDADAQLAPRRAEMEDSNRLRPQLEAGVSVIPGDQGIIDVADQGSRIGRGMPRHISSAVREYRLDRKNEVRTIIRGLVGRCNRSRAARQSYRIDAAFAAW